MPLVTNLIDDKSPLIQYDSTWIPGNSMGDPYADRYYLGTFSTNNVTNGQASFSFNGTGVWIYGAKRSNHATYYYVQLDGVTWGPYNGVSTTQAFMQPIFNDSGLTQKMHTLTLTNQGSGSNNYVDIDLIVWQSEVGNSDQQVIRETVQDTDSRFQYHNSAWSSSPSDAKFYSNGTGHYTEVDGAAVTLTFTGEMVTLFGAIGTSNGLYSVQLDGGNATQYNGTAFLPFYGVTLFHADNLGSGQHQVTLTNTASVTGQQLSIDYAIVSTLSDDTSSNAISYQLSTGDIVGIALCGAIAVLAFVLAFSLWRKLKGFKELNDQLYDIGITREPPGTLVAFSTSMETRPVSLVRRDASSMPDAVSEGVTPFPSSGTSDPISQSSGKPLPETRRQTGSLSSTPTPKRRRARAPPAQNTDSAESPSPVQTEPPNYVDVV